MQSSRSELRRLQQAYNALKQEVTDYKTALKEEKQKHRRLRRAIPPFPEPEKLYTNIVSRCREFYECTKRMAALNTRIRSLQTSSADWTARFHELELIEATVDRMRIEFLFVRSQIRTLFSVPPLLIAKGTVSENIWNARMEREQVNDEDEPLLMKPNIIEAAIADQLELLEGHRLALHDLRCSLQEQFSKTTATFQETTVQTLQYLHSTLETLTQQNENNAEVLRQFRSSFEEFSKQGIIPTGDSAQPEIHVRDPSEEGEGAPREAHEDEIIRENAQYMEEVNDVAAEREEPLNAPQPENAQLRQEGHDNGAEREEQRNPPLRENENSASRRRSVEQEIQRLKQEELNLCQIIEDLQSRRTCPPRRFERGEIRLEGDRFMRCAFCNLMGVHYSDSCNAITTAQQRRRLVEERRLCTLCLEFCTGGRYCQKRNTRCYHCHQVGHHSAICDLPEVTEQILRRVLAASQERLRCRRRIEELKGPTSLTSLRFARGSIAEAIFFLCYRLEARR